MRPGRDRRGAGAGVGAGMLITTANLDDPDGVYEALMAAHRDLAPEESRRLDVRLVLLLANHIGSAAVVRAAIALASAGGCLISTKLR